jgi:hypothetical protein
MILNLNSIQIYNKRLMDPSKMHMVRAKTPLASRTELATPVAALVEDAAEPDAPVVLDPVVLPEPPEVPVLPGVEAEEVLLEVPSPPVVVDLTTAGQVKL